MAKLDASKKSYLLAMQTQDVSIQKKKSTVVVVGKVRKNNAATKAVKAPRDNDGTKIHKLTRIQLGEHTERETKFLPSCKTDDNIRVSQVRIVVKKHPAEINRVRIQFQNGTEQFFNVNKHLAVDQVSPWVDLQGGNRCIQSVSFVGDADTVGFKPNAQSTIVGKDVRITSQMLIILIRFISLYPQQR